MVTSSFHHLFLHRAFIPCLVFRMAWLVIGSCHAFLSVSLFSSQAYTEEVGQDALGGDGRAAGGVLPRHRVIVSAPPSIDRSAGRGLVGWSLEPVLGWFVRPWPRICALGSTGGALTSSL